MKLIKMRGPKCMIASAAMLFGCTMEEVEAFLGHDGLSVVDDKYRGIHIQELQRFAQSKGYALALYEPEPSLDTGSVDCWDAETIGQYLKMEGLMLGITTDNKPHCVAWDGEQVLDPAKDEKFMAYQQFWARLDVSSRS